MIAPLSDLEVGYLAGLVDGEGWIGTARDRGRITPVVQLRMSDEDIIQRASGALGVSYRQNTCPSHVEGGYKPQFQIDVRGRRALALLDLLYPILGERRRDRIDNLKKEIT